MDKKWTYDISLSSSRKKNISLIRHWLIFFFCIRIRCLPIPLMKMWFWAWIIFFFCIRIRCLPIPPLAQYNSKSAHWVVKQMNNWKKQRRTQTDMKRTIGSHCVSWSQGCCPLSELSKKILGRETHDATDGQFFGKSGLDSAAFKFVVIANWTTNSEIILQPRIRIAYNAMALLLLLLFQARNWYRFFLKLLTILHVCEFL